MTRPPSATERSICDVLKALPLKKRVTEEHCRASANLLNGVVVMALMNHRLPITTKAGANTARSELKKLADYAEKIAKTMNRLHAEATSAIEEVLGPDRSLSKFADELNAVHRVFYQADVNSDAITAKAKKPSNEFAYELTEAAAGEFTALTGLKSVSYSRQVPVDGPEALKAQSYGPFLDFLTALYDAVGVKANPDYQARRLVKDKSTKK